MASPSRFGRCPNCRKLVHEKTNVTSYPCKHCGFEIRARSLESGTPWGIEGSYHGSTMKQSSSRDQAPSVNNGEYQRQTKEEHYSTDSRSYNTTTEDYSSQFPNSEITSHDSIEVEESNRQTFPTRKDTSLDADAIISRLANMVKLQEGSSSEGTRSPCDHAIYSKLSNKKISGDCSYSSWSTTNKDHSSQQTTSYETSAYSSEQDVNKGSPRLHADRVFMQQQGRTNSSYSQRTQKKNTRYGLSDARELQKSYLRNVSSGTSSTGSSSSRGGSWSTKSHAKRITRREHCRPVLGGMPFILCEHCSQLLHMPSIIRRKGHHNFRCGACNKILTLSLPINSMKLNQYRGGAHQRNTESYTSAPGSIHEEYEQSSGESRSTVDSYPQDPLHRLMGYESARYLLHSRRF